MTAGGSSGRVALYASAGRTLAHFALDPGSAGLTPQGTVTLPDNVQYAWPHPDGRTLYVAWSNGVDGDHHGVSALRIDIVRGGLAAVTDPVALPQRTIHATVDPAGRFLLLAFNKTRTVMVRRLNRDGTVGEAVAQPAAPDGGFFTHQVRVAPGGRLATTCAIGAPARPDGTPEQPGQITVFDFADGILHERQAIRPGAGLGPRHLDFHPALPLAYVAIERGNRLAVHALGAEGLGATPLFSADTLADRATAPPQQRAGAVHVHPSGRFAYVSNRSDAVQGGVFAGGENAIAVFALDPATGAPRLVQHAPTGGVEPRCFAIDPSGRVLVASNQKSFVPRAGAAALPPGLACFRIAADGTLAAAGGVPLTHGGDAFWCGMVALPG
jgi:6-phosphogluconolactonase (cycloisomerase 2 family)